ncbi:unnamed protein product, partial [Heterosigma akashiwo]
RGHAPPRDPGPGGGQGAGAAAAPQRQVRGGRRAQAGVPRRAGQAGGHPGQNGGRHGQKGSEPKVP